MNHPDPIYATFVSKQASLLGELARLNPGLLGIRQPAANAWFLELHCKGLIRQPGHEVQERDCFHVGVLLSPDYLRRVEPTTVSMLTPHVWHPNVNGPAMCLGRIRPATPISDLVIQIVEILCYLNYTPVEHDALNAEACQWARNHTGRFPLERRGIHLPDQFIS